VNQFYLDQFNDLDTTFLEEMDYKRVYEEDTMYFESFGEEKDEFEEDNNFDNPDEDFDPDEETDCLEFKENEIIYDLEEESESTTFYDECEFSVHFNDEDNKSQTSIDSVPFWFSNEDDDHLKYIWNMYMEFLNVDNKCRCFKMFIGKIRRQIVENFGALMTLDNIEIYKKSPYCPLGGKMPLHERITLLTTWNLEGLPFIFKDLSNDQQLYNFWAKRAAKFWPSNICCIPVWETKDDFEFSVSSDDKIIGYAQEPFNYSKFIPPKNEDSDDFESFDLN